MKSTLSTPFCRSLAFSFAGVLLVAPFFHRALRARFTPEPDRVITSVQDFSWLDKLPISQDLALRETDQERIKQERAWWLFERSTKHERSSGVRVNRDPRLFDDLFPNYGDSVRLATGFWEKYFENIFQAVQYFPSLLPSEMAVATTTLGCLDLVSQFGGDYLILGNSETMWGMVPKTFASKLSGSQKRVAACTRSAHTPFSIMTSADYLEQENRFRNRPKFKAVILGFSQMWAYPESSALAMYERENTDEFSDYLKRRKMFSPPGWLGWKGRTDFPLPKWIRLFPVNWDLVHGKDRLRQTDAVPFDMLGRSLTLKIPRGGFAHDFSAIAINREDLPNLRSIVNDVKQDYFIYDGIEKAGCRGLTTLETQARQLVETLSRAADDVYIFLTPVTRSHTLATPPCMRSGVKKIMASLRSPNIHVLTEEKEFYGLEETDFTYPKSATQLYYDPNHLNFEGAKKVSSILATWISKE